LRTDILRTQSSVSDVASRLEAGSYAALRDASGRMDGAAAGSGALTQTSFALTFSDSMRGLPGTWPDCLLVREAVFLLPGCPWKACRPSCCWSS